ncbi:MAG: HIT domain-containing protein [Candidatus Niyogibacteria bacterium]|nr:HIT domain-containing protein [Candidatus Niyogibacteria bacterium]
MPDCIFCSIAHREKEADIIQETDDVMIFRDIRPKAPVHLLIVPKKHIASMIDLPENEVELLGKMFMAARDIARDQGLDGYKLLFNVGRKGGQFIDHLHLHLMGGWVEQQSE